MAFKPRTAPSTDTDDTIVALDDHPQFQSLIVLRRTLTAARTDRQDRIDLASIEAELGRASAGPRADGLRGRAANLRKTLPRPGKDTPSATTSSAGITPAVAQALDLLQGKFIDPLRDETETLRRLHREVAVIDVALAEIVQTMDQVRSDLSWEVAEKLKSQHRQVLRTVYDAAVALTAAIDAERALYAVPLVAGYEGRPDVLNRPALDGASRLGSASEWDSQISTFRRRLESLGVI